MSSYNDVEMQEACDGRIPTYPEGIFPPDEKHDIPPFKGDKTNLTERRNVKLYNLWTIWSDLRRNEKLVKGLEANKSDSKDVEYLKAMMTIVIDRMGKVLADTNIVEEICSMKATTKKEEGEDAEESLEHDTGKEESSDN